MSNQFNNGAEMKYFSFKPINRVERISIWTEKHFNYLGNLRTFSPLFQCSDDMMADVPGESDCCRDKEEEIYITSASVIELDCRKAADNDSYDSGIYNSSTHTGDQCSDVSVTPVNRAPNEPSRRFHNNGGGPH